jgi:hypothetical protein
LTPRPLRNARAKAFDQDVGTPHQLQRRIDRATRLQVERHRALVAVVEVEARRHRRADVDGRGTVDAHHVGTHVGQQRAAERRGADGRELQHTNSAQGSRHDVSLESSRRFSSLPYQVDYREHAKPRSTAWWQPSVGVFHTSYAGELSIS